ncbi:MAG: response regulator [Planctomycetes bacterium]|jgi:signal transduction histidine kinase|nr:response regulator [Planctomycetota bacterium]MBT6540815.1 response regulator [Planctomycetota bacterium]MBT7104159.1 response regulator [Planctomycetota bacterium]
MSFRLKTVLGIAIIEGFLLMLLVWSSSQTLENSTFRELEKRGITAADMIAAAAKDAILSNDLGRINSIVKAIVDTEGIVYARIRTNLNPGLTPSEESAGDPKYLTGDRVEDQDVEHVDDGVYDVKKELTELDEVVGSIELGISTAELEMIREQSLQRLAMIAVIEMLLVALFSLALGNYLTGELARLETAARTVADGDLGHQVDVTGTDEIARTIRSFNDMSRRVQGSYQELQQSEILYRSSQQRLDGLVASLLEGVCLLDDQQRIRFINPAARDHLLKLGNSSVEIGATVQFPDLKREQVIVDSGLAAFELTTTLNDIPHIFELTSRLVPNQQDNEKEYVVVMRDVTDLRKSQKALQEHQQMTTVGQLAAGIAHDFNNILTVILGYSELTLNSEELPEVVREYSNRILLQGERAAQLIRQILDFSRKVESESERIDLVEFIPETVQMLHSGVPSSIEVKQHFDEGVAHIEFNATKLQQVLANLLLNAADALPDGGTISIRTDLLKIGEGDSQWGELAVGDWVRLRVEDDGVGIPAGMIDRIFDPFFTTKPVGKGTGLGLSQVYGLVKSHDGMVNVESVQGVGTTFTILFPVCETVAHVPRQELPKIRRSASSAGPKTILLVEDQPEVLNALEFILHSLGFQVLSAIDGEKAVEVVQKRGDEIDAVLSDIVMPILRGDQLVEKLLELGFDKPIFLMSGYFPKEINLEDFSGSIAGFLQKPIRTEELKKLLSVLLE